MNHKAVLFWICVITLAIRLGVAFSAPALSYNAYETVRQVEHIHENGLPLVQDTLSWGGRTILELPVFSYLIAFTTLFIPRDIAYILIPNICAIFLQVAVFLLAMELTSDTKLSLYAAAASVFIPVYWSSTLLTVSPLSLAIPLFITCITLFLKLRKTPERRNLLLGLFVILVLTSPIAFIFVPFIIISLILVAIRHSKGERAQLEFAVFSIFFLLWFNTILYKQSLSAVGMKTLTANIPAAAFTANVFSVYSLGLAIGLAPFGLALYTAYKDGVGNHIGVQTTIALALTIGGLIAAQWIPSDVGFSLLASVCIVLAAVGIQHINRYSRMLRRKTLPRSFATTLIIIFIITNIIPTALAAAQAQQDTANPDVIAAANWLKENSLPSANVLAPPSWGFLIENTANRATYIDEDYMGRSDAEERYEFATGIIARTESPVLADRKHITYVMSAEQINHDCLNTVYSKGVYIAKVLCQ